MRNMTVPLLIFCLLPTVVGAAEGEGGPVLSHPLPSAGASAPASLPVEETPGFQAVRPLTGPAEASAMPASVPSAPADGGARAAPAPVPPLAPVAAVPAPATPSVAAPVVSTPAVSAPAVSAPAVSAPAVAAPVVSASVSWPVDGVGSALLLIGGGLVGGLLAGSVGVLTAATLHGRDRADRRRAIAATLAIELEARRQAFEMVPAPPNAEAGVSFVSSVVALAEFDAGWRSAQGALYLLPDKLAGHLSVHYGAVHHVAAFVKGQSFASALRMLQANRIGGYPCPDAGVMRDAHVELAAAFRGMDKLLQGLRTLA